MGDRHQRDRAGRGVLTVLGCALDLPALALRQLASGPAPWDYDLTAGSLPPVLSVARASTATRVNAAGLIVTEAANAARFDYDPLTHVCRGLLIEPQRTYMAAGAWTNVLGTGWVMASGASATGVSAASPVSATDTIERATGTQTFSSINISGAVVSAGAATQYWLIRNVDSAGSRLVLRSGTTSSQVSLLVTWSGADIASLSTTANVNGMTVAGTGAIEFPNKWFLVWMAETWPTTDTVIPCRIDPAATTAAKYIDIAASGLISGVWNGLPSIMGTSNGVASSCDADVVIVADTARAYRITYTPLAGGSAQTVDVAIGQQPAATPGRWTRIQQL